MYDMSKTELTNYLAANTNNNASPIVYVEYQYYQLGDGEDWFNKMCGLLMYDQIAIRRELLLQRLNGSNNSPFSLEDLMAITDSKKSPIREEIIMGKYMLEIYREVDKRKIVLMSIDTSTGIGQDSNAITIIDPDTEEPVAEFNCKFMSSPDLRKFVYYITKRFYPNAIIIPERNMGGYALVDELLETDIGHRIYYEDVKDISTAMDDRLDKHGFMKQEAMARKIRGVQTTGKSRELMMKILNTRVQENKDKFITQNITNDLNNLVLTTSGKVEAAKGKHDDSVMSYLIGMYVLLFGKNLARFGYVKGIGNIKERNSGLEYSEEAIFEELEKQTGIDVHFDKDSFKSGTKTEQSSYDEYAALMAATRKKHSSVVDPFSINETRNVGETEADIYSRQGSIPLSLFSELNS